MSRVTCFIVRRGCTDTFDVLSREFAPHEIPVIWDRRVQERRRDAGSVGAERRRSDRRQGAAEQASTLQKIDFICVKVDADASLAQPSSRS